jgi:hypothetical protein
LGSPTGISDKGANAMRLAATLVFGLGVLANPALAHAQHREMGAHEHGRGTLNVAIEGSRLSMELEVPGADIVGFEHAATTSKQKAAVEKGKKQLLAPLALFKLPAAAGCTVSAASVEVEGEGHHGEHGRGKNAAGGNKAREPEAHNEPAHSEFHAQYTFECKTPGNLSSIEFAFFRTFSRAERLEVNVVTPKGQTKFEVSRRKPRIDLAGMM